MAQRRAKVTEAKSKASKPALNPAMRAALSAIGKIGGKRGGVARWKGVSPEARREITRRAAEARWSKRKATGR